MCFRLQVKPDRIDEYVERHREVWPDMLRALARTGWHNYSLFLDPSGLLIGYFETPSLEQARAGMAETEVNRLWQEEMKEFFVGVDSAAVKDFVQLREVFNLDEQLAQVDTREREER